MQKMPEIGEPLSILHVELSEPKANEVLVKIKATGVSHSDLNRLRRHQQFLDMRERELLKRLGQMSPT
ncbi:hypothetical protein [Neobacillus drentensis]|uniref:hypothetical protein n=1 Tax=Neobacillus drentensis TaxID=220684 RepID=UPI0030014D4F